VLTFLGLLTIILWDYRMQGGAGVRFSIPELTQGLVTHPLPVSWQVWIFAALFMGFAIKVPLFPLHTWLPLAHVQAPVAGSIVLAGVLLKIGVYGFLRFNVPMLPDGTAFFMPLMLWLAVIGIIYGALVSLVQADMKRLVAYSSVSHLGFCMLGLFALNPLGVQGSVLQMVNHGISTGALFAIIGMIYDRYHTRRIADFSGLARRMPWLAFFMVFFTFSSVGLPGLNGFAGEFPILLGMFQRAWTGAAAMDRGQLFVIACLAVTGIIWGAWYLLLLVQRVFFGPLKEPHVDHAHHAPHGGEQSRLSADMSLREILALAPLAVLALWIGLRPGDFYSRMEPSIQRATAAATARIERPFYANDPRAVAAPAPEKLTRVR
jgi:NADH-quinone oxidoreductase subunit M